jgi:hypothetical protein
MNRMLPVRQEFKAPYRLRLPLQGEREHYWLVLMNKRCM